MQFSDGVKIRAQIDTDSMKAMLAVAGGGSVALLAFLPYLLGKQDMAALTRAVVWALLYYQLSLVVCLVHNVLRRHCSAKYEAAWAETVPGKPIKQPEPGSVLGVKLKKHPTVCFWSWTFLWLAVVAFAAGSFEILLGGLAVLPDAVPSAVVEFADRFDSIWRLAPVGLALSFVAGLLLLIHAAKTRGATTPVDVQYVVSQWWLRAGYALLAIGFLLQLLAGLGG